MRAANRIEFKVADNSLRLVADAWGDPRHPAVLLAHGGGQTRHAWGETARLLSEQGKYAIALDLRGHGESDWDKEGRYDFSHYAQDLRDVVGKLTSKPAAVGASLGGISTLIAHHLSDQNLFSEIVLVDITPRVEMDGLGRIRDFMLEHAEKGFASLDEAAAFVASYTPNRKRSDNNRHGSNEGLKKNLRLGEDGRYRWHWDPKFFAKRPDQKREGHVKFTLMEDAAKALVIPTMLVRGKISDLVSSEGAQEFLDLVPHAKFVDIEEAGHMVAGDKNDIFSSAVIDFLCRK